MVLNQPRIGMMNLSLHLYPFINFTNRLIMHLKLHKMEVSKLQQQQAKKAI